MRIVLTDKKKIKKSSTVEVKPQQSVSNIFTFIIKLYIYTIDP